MYLRLQEPDRRGMNWQEEPMSVNIIILSVIWISIFMPVRPNFAS